MKTMEKEGKREISTILYNFGQFWQVRTRQQIRKMGQKGRENKKKEQKFNGD